MTVFSHPIRHLALCSLAGILAPLAIGILACGAVAPAQAQNAITGGVLGPGSSTAGAGGTQQNGKPSPPRPSALPGTRTEKSEPVPADRLASDMAPNEALFDGINRGDMVFVKDAISRGADLNARNILGLTPIDLSVDLGRNDITFLLLSLRGADGGSASPAPAGAGKSAKAILQAAGKAEPKPVRSAKSAREVAPPPPAAPKLFANDGGAPVPNAGFLGFGAQR
jgi:hypothetical protein